MVTAKISVLFLLGLSATIDADVDLSDTYVIDGHNDLPYNLYGKLMNKINKFDFNKDLTNDTVWGNKACGSCFTDLPRLKKGQVGAQFWVAYVSCAIQYKDSLGKTLDQIDVIKRLVAQYPNDMEFVTTAAGIENARSKNKIASLIGVEGGHSMDSRLGVLRMLYDLGARYMTLTHTCNTPWADNSNVDDATPVHNLTAFGMDVVKEMNRLGMMVDLSHVSHAVMNEAIMTSKAPVIFSHSSAYGVHKHHRNVRDDTLELLKKNNGIIMVNFYPRFISPTPNTATLSVVADHINYIVDKIGVDYVGLGADYDGVEMQPIGLEDVSKYPDLLKYLIDKNSTRWTINNINKLASQNFLRVFRDVEKVKVELEKTEKPIENWIPIDDLNAVAEAEQLWKCRTLLNNTSATIVNNIMYNSGAILNFNYYYLAVMTLFATKLFYFFA